MILQIKSHPSINNETFDSIKICYRDETDHENSTTTFKIYDDSKVAIIEVSLYAYDELT